MSSFRVSERPRRNVFEIRKIFAWAGPPSVDAKLNEISQRVKTTRTTNREEMKKHYLLFLASLSILSVAPLGATGKKSVGEALRDRNPTDRAQSVSPEVKRMAKEVDDICKMFRCDEPGNTGEVPAPRPGRSDQSDKHRDDNPLYPYHWRHGGGGVR